MKLFNALETDLEVQEEKIIVQRERNFKQSEADDKDTNLKKFYGERSNNSSKYEKE